MNAIANLLKETTGLDPAALSATAIQRAIRQRMKALSLCDVVPYQRLLQPGSHEWHELVESVVVGETWFFRDAEAFKGFARIVVEEWLPRNPGKTMRILSLPCSSGEEPYSLFMALREAHVPDSHYEIEGVDISARALALARAGHYTKNSFRGKELHFRNKFFTPQSDGFLIDPTARAKVKFLEGNMMSGDFPHPAAGYDFIFCRNLLIYFDRPAQTKAIAKLRSLLAPAGMLFAGPAEQALLLDHGFESANIPMAFACRANDAAGTGFLKPRPARLAELPALWQESPPTYDFSQTSDSAANFSLQAVEKLAVEGRSTEAIALCEAHLHRFAPSAKVWHLLGRLRDSLSYPDARECYRRALYLEPNHYESLLQMAALSEKSGDASRAQTFRARAARSKPGLL